MAFLLGFPKFVGLDGNGDPLAAGKLYAYDAGTSNAKDTYSDRALSAANANPVVLDASGQATVYLNGKYKFILKDSDDNTIWTVDEVGEILDEDDMASDSAKYGVTQQSLKAYVSSSDISGAKVSANDTTGGYLNGKLVAGDGIDFTEGNDGGDETLTIDVETATESNAGMLETATDAEARTMSADDKIIVPDNLPPLFYGIFSRPKFIYNNATTIRINGAQYMCKDKYCYWTSQLTTTAIAGAADEIYYLYLDYSAITSGTEITNSELIWSTTAPTNDSTYRGRYNSDDLCIFAVATDGAGDLREFYHNGCNYVEFDAHIACDIGGLGTGLQDVDDTFLDVTLVAPDWGSNTRIQICVYNDADGADGQWIYVRRNGSAATANIVGNSHNQANNETANTFPIYADSNQKIEIAHANAGASKVAVNTVGWYFPGGM